MKVKTVCARDKKTGAESSAPAELQKAYIKSADYLLATLMRRTSLMEGHQSKDLKV